MRLIFLFALVVVVLSFFATWRALDHWTDRNEMKRLIAMQPQDPKVFDYAMIATLPEPAQRYFRFAISEGTPLLTVADIRMTGKFSLGTKEDPNYMQMEARQILAAPEGSVWKVRMRSGHLRFSGSDTGTWTRFWMGGLMPVARQGGTDDHTRSAFGRYVAEAVFWTPAAVLPGPGITWSHVDENTARLSVTHNGMVQDVDLSVAATGEPTQILFQRWSNSNPSQTHQLQPFGGTLSQFRNFDGYRLPTRVEAGNLFGTDDYFPFYIAEVRQISFPHPTN